MSTCPAKDIHCLYADGELQEPFKTEFEVHTASCPQCRKRLSRYLDIREKMRAESDTLSLSGTELDEGYMRLKARLSYKKTVLPARNFSGAAFGGLSAIAAAAVFAVLFPLRFFGGSIRTQSNSVDSSSLAVRAEPIQKRGIVAPENVPAASLVSLFGNGDDVRQDMPQLTPMDVFKPELSANISQIQIPLTAVSHMPLILITDHQTFYSIAEDPFR